MLSCMELLPFSLCFCFWGAVRDTALFFSLLGVVFHFVETVQFYRLLPKTGVQEVEQTVQKND